MGGTWTKTDTHDPAPGPHLLENGMGIRAGYAECFASPEDVDTPIGHDIEVLRNRQSEIVHPYARDVIAQRRSRKPLAVLACTLREGERRCC